MAYGVTSSTLLLATGVAGRASAAVHFSEIGTTLVSGISHHRLGNVDWRTVGIIAIPGGIGAFAGATFLASIDGDTAKPWVAALLLALGVYVVYRFLPWAAAVPVQGPGLHALPRPARRRRRPDGLHRRRRLGPGRHHLPAVVGPAEPRKVVGSIDTSEFVVAVGGSLGFLLALGSQGIHWGIVAALLVGGVIAAPFAAWLVKHLPPGSSGSRPVA